MPEADGYAQLENFLSEEIPKLATLYDRFAHALDPFDEGCTIAERTFNAELAVIYDYLPDLKPPFRDFRRWVISRSKKHIQASDKPSSI